MHSHAMSWLVGSLLVTSGASVAPHQLAGAAVTHDATYEPTYCDISGSLPMEACALTNMVIAKDFYQRVLASRHPSAKERTAEKRTTSRIDSKCSRVRAASYARNGSGSLVEIEEQQCQFTELHAAASGLLGRKSAPDILPYDSVREPRYCDPTAKLTFACAYANRRLALDFLYRVTVARFSEPSLIHGARTEAADEADAACPPPTLRPSEVGIEKYDAAALAQLDCLRNAFHSKALLLLP